MVWDGLVVRESFASHQESKKRLRTVIWVGLVVGLVVRESFASHQEFKKRVIKGGCGCKGGFGWSVRWSENPSAATKNQENG